MKKLSKSKGHTSYSETDSCLPFYRSSPMQVRSAVLAALCYGSAVAWLPPGAIGRAARHGTNAVQMAALSPGDNVFVLGRGPVMLLSAKIAANAGYKTSIIDGPNMADFLGEVPSNLELIAPGDVDRLSGALAEAAGMIFATDDSAAMTEDTLDLVLPPSGGSARAVKRVVGMSRNAVTTTEEGGGSGMGFFTAMAKKAANNQIWDAAPKECAAFRTFEASIRRRAEAYGASATVMRAGTLKGGGPGDPAEGVGPSEKACLSPAYYTMMPGQDLVNWQVRERARVFRTAPCMHACMLQDGCRCSSVQI